MKYVPYRLRRQMAGIWSIASLLSMCLLWLLLIPAQAQLYTGSITGLVQDPSGAVVANASVVLTDTDKGLTYSTKTDAAGRYVLRALPPSTYNTRVEAA